MNKKVLIIDDNNEFLLKISSILMRKEVFVEKKTTLFDITKKDIDGFDLVICDQELTADEKTGLDFLIELKKMGYSGELILLSGFDLEAKAKKEGIVYIEKTPSGLGRLLEFVRK